MSDFKREKDMKGVLFVNSNKKNPKQPDYIGSCQINGNEYRIAGWNNESAEGKQYISLSFTIPLSKDQLEKNRTEQTPQSSNQQDNIDNIDNLDELEEILKIVGQ